MYQIELEIWARMLERERSLRRINESAWQEQTWPGTPGNGTARRLLGVWVMRVGAWLAGTSLESATDIHHAEPCSSVRGRNGDPPRHRKHGGGAGIRRKEAKVTISDGALAAAGLRLGSVRAKVFAVSLGETADAERCAEPVNESNRWAWRAANRGYPQ